jgi:ribosomal-protein-alanine N-acetyltransferase
MKIPVLRTKNYTLRRYRMTDAPVAAENLANRKINYWLSSIPTPYRLKDAQEWIAKTMREYRKKQPKKIVWVIEDKGEMIGAVGIHSIVFGHKAEIGYWLSDKAWGRGVMTEVVKEVTGYAMKEFKLIRLEARVYKDNYGSEKVLLKNGF